MPRERPMRALPTVRESLTKLQATTSAAVIPSTAASRRLCLVPLTEVPPPLANQRAVAPDRPPPSKVRAVSAPRP